MFPIRRNRHICFRKGVIGIMFPIYETGSVDGGTDGRKEGQTDGREGGRKD